MELLQAKITAANPRHEIMSAIDNLKDNMKSGEYLELTRLLQQVPDTVCVRVLSYKMTNHTPRLCGDRYVLYEISDEYHEFEDDEHSFLLHKMRITADLLFKGFLVHGRWVHVWVVDE